MSCWYYLFFFLSGLTALILETTFTRQLSLIFGSSLPAISVVLAIFMGGMALGAAYLSPRGDHRHPLRLYGILEIGVGTFALAAVLILPILRHVYAGLSGIFPYLGATRILLQGTLAALVLLPATILMGATLPVLVRGLTSALQQRWNRISLLYGINTMGAAIGTLLCGFILIEQFGYLKTVVLATTGNLIIGGMAILLAGKIPWSALTQDPAPPVVLRQKSPAANKSSSSETALQKLLLVFAALSGLAALGYEVAWFRILTFSVVADVYAFALMLGIYLIGIGGGSLLAAWRLRLRGDQDHSATRSWLELGILEVSICALVVLGFIAYNLTNNYFGKPDLNEAHYWGLILRNTAVRALILILPTTLILGYVFPLLLSLATPSLKSMSSRAGRVIAVNTLGAIFGCLGCGFVLIPLIGIQYSLFVLAALSALIGLTTLTFAPLPKSTRKLSLILSAPVVILLLLRFPISPNLGFHLIPSHDGASLLFYHEGADQTVMVTEDLEDRHTRRLILNQQQATSTGMAGQRKNQLLGHLPLWACPQAKKALVICFGSGATFGALGLYDLERVDCVEICPVVPRTARYFSEWNADVLNRPQVRLIIDDGRSYLLTTKEKYDVITLEPMHPGLKGVTSLYSFEFYREAKECLNPGGALCQWVPLYSMSGQDARALMATAVAVFPQTSLWIVGSEGILLCPHDDLAIDWNHINAQYSRPEVQKALKRVLLDNPWSILSGFLLGPESLKSYLTGTPIIYDDHPFTEYSIPRHQQINPWSDILTLEEKRECPMVYFTNISDESRDSLMERWETRKPAWIDRDRGLAAYEQGEIQSARQHLEAAVESNPLDRYAIHFLKEIYWLYGVQLSMRGQWQDAVVVYQKACDLDSEDAEAHFYLAMALKNAGRNDESEIEARKAAQIRLDYKAANQLVTDLQKSR